MFHGGSRILGRRCLFFLLEGIQTLYFPSFQFVRQNHNEAQGGGSFRCSSHSTLVANSTLVSTASPIIGPASYPSASVGGAPNVASEGFSTSSPRCNAPNGVAYIRDNLQVRGISPRAASFLLVSWRPGTEKQYSAAWRCFWCCYDKKQRNPLLADLRTVCDFLTEQFEDFDKSYSTTILTDLHCPLCYYLKILLYPIIPRLLKETFHVCPTEPRYSFFLGCQCFVDFLGVIVSSLGLRT